MSHHHQSDHHGGKSHSGKHHEYHPVDHFARAREQKQHDHDHTSKKDDVDRPHRPWLLELATKAMHEAHFLTTFEDEALAEADALTEASMEAKAKEKEYRDVSHLLWVSIDNDDTRDIDQITASEEHEDGTVSLHVAIADVDGVIAADGPIDKHALNNTTSVYTPAAVFTMLPERLCYGLTSLVQGVVRPAIVISIRYAGRHDVTVLSEHVYLGRVVNKAKLAYNSVSAWLDGTGPLPAPLEGHEDLQNTIRVQDILASELLKVRRTNGTLEFDRPEMQVVFDGDRIASIVPAAHTRSSRLIENVMIAANGAVSRFLDASNYTSIQRVLRKTENWGELVRLAQSHGMRLSAEPDALSLRAFLSKAHASMATDLYQDLCLNVIKLLGRGEYVAAVPHAAPVGHFALAVSEYAHATAPNRRYPDIAVHRIVKIALRDGPAASPTDMAAVAAIAEHCSAFEAASSKIERRLRKSAVCILLRGHEGEEAPAVISGASESGVWARFTMNGVPAEGRVHSKATYHVGDPLTVRLKSVDVEQGFVDVENVADAGQTGATAHGGHAGPTHSSHLEPPHPHGSHAGHASSHTSEHAAGPTHSGHGGHGAHTRHHARTSLDSE